MEYVIVGLLVLAIILLLINLLRKNNNTDVVDRLSSLELSMVKEIGEFKVNFASDIRKDFDTLDEKVDRKLTEINNRVTERLDQSLEKTNKTFANVLERLSKIDEAQKKIDGLGEDIISLQSILTDKKTRGIFGEVNLQFILENAFGGLNTGIYDLQHKMSNGYIADAILYAPAPLGTIAIDSKFPLENYERMTNKSLSKEERLVAEKQFKIDFKKHIDAIASKYIIPGETSNEAILFLPAEAIFAEVNAYHTDILNYAYSRKVWITSPTTLMSTLTVIEMILKNMERDKYAKIIHEELNKLSVEFARYRERWERLARNINTVSKSVEELNTTSDKITKRFDSINRVEVEKLKNEEQDLLVHE
ncbi:MAG TPA: DNA recombination protein RmuC [Candidatus Caccenecus avistercoris]|nr:DNA recombination protein RmuC [Candidatus Caccenecus avistercoris]